MPNIGSCRRIKKNLQLVAQDNISCSRLCLIMVLLIPPLRLHNESQ